MKTWIKILYWLWVLPSQKDLDKIENKIRLEWNKVLSLHQNDFQHIRCLVEKRATIQQRIEYKKWIIQCVMLPMVLTFAVDGIIKELDKR